MTQKDINSKYTAVVAEFMAKGYTINAGTMSGSQGEMAHIDLTNGEEIIRVLLDSFTWGFCQHGLEIVVGRVTDNVEPNKRDGVGATVWNNHLEVLYSEQFYELGEHRDYEKWYGTKEEAETKNVKQEARYENRRVINTKDFSEDAKQVVLTFVKRQPKCKSVKVSDITKVQKVVRVNSFTGKVNISYKVTAKGTEYILR